MSFRSKDSTKGLTSQFLPLHCIRVKIPHPPFFEGGGGVELQKYYPCTLFIELFAIGSEASVPAPALQPGQVLLELGGGRQAIPTV